MSTSTPGFLPLSLHWASLQMQTGAGATGRRSQRRGVSVQNRAHGGGGEAAAHGVPPRPHRGPTMTANPTPPDTVTRTRWKLPGWEAAAAPSCLMAGRGLCRGRSPAYFCDVERPVCDTAAIGQIPVEGAWTLAGLSDVRTWGGGPWSRSPGSCPCQTKEPTAAPEGNSPNTAPGISAHAGDRLTRGLTQVLDNVEMEEDTNADAEMREGKCFPPAEQIRSQAQAHAREPRSHEPRSHTALPRQKLGRR